MASGSSDNQDDKTDVQSSGFNEVSDEALGPTGPVPFAKSLNARTGLAIYGIFVPIVCHFSTINHAPSPADWQSGQLTAKLSFVLSGECGWPIFPFLIFAMVCLAMVIRNETWAFAKPWVRFGIFSGVIVCGWYLLAFSVTAMGGIHTLIGLLIGAIAWLLVVHGSIWFLPTMIYLFDSNAILRGIVLVGGTLLLTITVVSGGLLLGLPLIFILLLSTPLAFLSYLGVSIRIFKLHNSTRRFTIAQLMAWVTWLVVFMSALRQTIELSFAKYAQLPLEPSSECYVATAVANGYPRIVGSERLPTTTGQPMVVNAQLANFKAAELTLRAISPNGHRVFRFFYDRLGPCAAKMLRGRLLATAAYLCLKPAEWLCRITLRTLLGRKTLRLAQQMYHMRAKFNFNDEPEGVGVQPRIKLRALQPKNAGHDGEADIG